MTVTTFLISLVLAQGISPKVDPLATKAAQDALKPYLIITKDADGILDLNPDGITSWTKLKSAIVSLGYTEVVDNGLSYFIHDRVYKNKKQSGAMLLLTRAKAVGLPTTIDASNSPDLMKDVGEMFRHSRFGRHVRDVKFTDRNLSVTVGVSYSGTLRKGNQQVPFNVMSDIPMDNLSQGGNSITESNTKPSLADRMGTTTVLFPVDSADALRSLLAKRGFEIAPKLEDDQHVPLLQFGDSLLQDYFKKLGVKDGWIGNGNRQMKNVPESVSAQIFEAIRMNPATNSVAKDVQASMESFEIVNGKSSVQISFRVVNADGHGTNYSFSLPAFLR